MSIKSAIPISALLLAASIAAAETGQLATYSIEFEIQGMRIDGTPEGAGDRSLRFDLSFDATDLDQANTLWYEHLELMFGPDVQSGLYEFATQKAPSRR